MAVAMHMQFTHCTQQQYDDVVKELKLKTQNPAGLLHHVAGPLENGGWCVMDVWETQGHFDRFFKEKLEASMRNHKIEPPQVRTFNVHNFLGPHAMARH